MGPTTQRTTPLAGSHLVPDLAPGTGRYRLRFARTLEDLDAVCRLRFQVFNLELDEGLDASYSTGLDRDQFDAQCQHLMVVEEATGEVVGTYRLQVAESARAGAGFYSESEFDFSAMPPTFLDSAVELGRACIAKEHRGRNVLFMLWRGLVAYVRGNDRRYFFGCSSLTSRNPDEGLAAYLQLKRSGHVHAELNAPPRPDYVCQPDTKTPPFGYVEIPTLFSLYLRFGAKVASPPAIDREFGTIDFLTVFDLERLDPRVLTAFAR